ncbi:MAG: hypothetical protein ABSC54_10010 [Smithellaceae bacterium]
MKPDPCFNYTCTANVSFCPNNCLRWSDIRDCHDAIGRQYIILKALIAVVFWSCLFIVAGCAFIAIIGIGFYYFPKFEDFIGTLLAWLTNFARKV